MTTRETLAFSPSTTRTSRSCVRGRGKGSSARTRRIACASPGPIQMGRMRSPSVSRRMTTFCWVLCSRMSPLTRASTTFISSRTRPRPRAGGAARLESGSSRSNGGASSVRMCSTIHFAESASSDFG